MTTKPLSIIVVGAGAAGYFTAAALKRNCNNTEVTVVHDPSVAHIGVGESVSWVGPTFFKKFLGLDNELSWMKQSKSNFKWAVVQQGFDKPDGAPYIFGSGNNWSVDRLTSHTTNAYDLQSQQVLPGQNTLYDMWVDLYNRGLVDRESNLAGMHNYYWYAKLNKSRTNFKLKDSLDPEAGTYSYHINANSIRHVVHQLSGIPAGVKEKPIPIKEVLTANGKITGLKLANDETITADLYIDCSGFTRLLVKELPYEWVDCNEYFNNSTLVGNYKYSSHDEHTSWTHHYAMKYGWCFGIPMDNRMGMGYQHNTRIFDNTDQIVDDFEKRFGKKNVISRVIKWNPGYYRNAFVGNCVAIGLSYGFADVFDANNFSISLRYIIKMIGLINNDNLRQFEWKDQYNQYCWDLSEDAKFRVQAGLQLATRNDTVYWKELAIAGKKHKMLEKVIHAALHDPARKYNQLNQNNNYNQQTFINTLVYYDYKIPNIDFGFTDQQRQLALNYFDFNSKKNKLLAEGNPDIGEFYKHYIFKDVVFG